MSIAPLDLQQMYAQQHSIGRMQHAQMLERALVMQAEDVDIRRDTYERESTVVETQETEAGQTVKERKENRKGQQQEDERFMLRHYRKKKRATDSDDEGEFYELDLTGGKGQIIDIRK